MKDSRFILIRQSESGIETWHAALILSKTAGVHTFRLTWPRHTRDRFGQAEQPTDLAEVAIKVIRDGARIRWVNEKTRQANSLGLSSRGVLRYELDPVIAAAAGVPSTGSP